MRVLIVSGIYPPDIGGPATHGADLREALLERGHDVDVLTLTDARRTVEADGVVRLPRRWGWLRRTLAMAWRIVRTRRCIDLVYAIGAPHAAALGAALVGRPVVMRVVADEVWERQSRRGRTDLSFDDFQSDPGDTSTRTMRLLRDRTLLAADHIVVPTDHVAGSVRRWTGERLPVSVVRNGVRAPTLSRPQTDGRLRLLAIGRLIPSKAVADLIEVVRPMTGVDLDVIGDGPDRAHLEELSRDVPHVRLLGPLSHADTLRELSQAHLLVSASRREGLPHVAIEALACGVPVLAVDEIGYADVVTHGHDGLLVSDAAALGAEVERLRDDRAALDRLAEAARLSGRDWSFDTTADRLEALFTGLFDRPRIVWFGKGGVPKGTEGLAKLDVMAGQARATIVAAGGRGPSRVRGVRIVRFPNGRPRAVLSPLFYLLAPVVAVTAALRGGVVVCQSPYEAWCIGAVRRLVPRALRPRMVVEVHGDWHTASRMYGSSRRRWLAPLTDRLAVRGLRKADRIRVVSDFTDALVHEHLPGAETVRSWAFADYSAFQARPVAPPPKAPRVLFVGALERYKGVDVLLDAWSLVVDRVPEASLTIVGDGTMGDLVRRRVAEAASVDLRGRVPSAEVASLLDDSRLMVLPSRSEGLGRVVLEAHMRGRPVVGSRVGGIAELVDHERTGLLVEPEDPAALADALVRLLTDDHLLDATSRGAVAASERRDPAASSRDGMADLAAWARAPERRLLLMNLATDPDDATLGFAVAWIEALAARYDGVDVLTMRAGRDPAIANVTVRSVGQGNRLVRAARFYRHLWALTRRHRYEAAFAHMMPLFLVLASPVLRLRGIRTVLWYAHGSVSPMLRRAARRADAIATSTPAGFRVPADHVVAVGQGIDTRVYARNGARPPDTPVILGVGRLSPVKRWDLFADVVGEVRSRCPDARGRVVGEPLGPRGREVRQALAAREGIDLAGPRRPSEMPGEYGRGHVLLHLSETGSLDKVALEAMACETAVISTNAEIADLVARVDPALVPAGHSPRALADAVVAWLARPAAEREATGRALRRLVREEHELTRLVERIDALLTAS